jgi:O-Antigen ligase
MALVIILDLLVIAILVSTAMRKSMDAALAVAACLLMIFPNQAQIPLPGLFDLTTQRLIVMVLLGLYLSVGRRTDAERPQGPLPLRFLLAVLIVWMLLSSAKSIVPQISFKSTLSEYFDFALIYIIYARSLSRAETVRKVFAGFVAGMVICSFFGLLEIYADWRVTSLFPAVSTRFADLASEADRGVRVQSTFDHSILFGAALSMAIPMGFFLLDKARSKGQKTYLWLAQLIMMLCLYKTDSRGPWIAAILSFALLVLFGKGRMRTYTGAIVLTTVLVIAVRPGVRQSVFDLYAATLDPDSPQGQSYQWRYVLFHVARTELSKDTGRSIWGFGPESFFYLGLTTDAMVDGEMHTVKVDSCDSAYVELMMDTGYVGLFIVALLLATGLLYSAYRFLTARTPDNMIYLIAFINLCAFSFLMSNVELWGWGQQSYMFWVVVAIAMSSPAQLHFERAKSSLGVPARVAFGAAR